MKISSLAKDSNEQTISEAAEVLSHSTRPQDSHPTTVATRLTIVFYLLTLALLPWCWFPPFPWLHEHAQWSDVFFAVTMLAWLAEKWQSGNWPRLRPVHAAWLLYLTAILLSLLLAAPDRHAGVLKTLGMIELCLLAVLTADLMTRPGMSVAVTRTIAGTTLATTFIALAGLILFYAGIHTRLIGLYGDLVQASGYARIQAATLHPNLLSNFCIFAFAVIARHPEALPQRWRRIVQAGLCLTVLLTFSRGILGFVLAMLVQSSRNRTGRRLACVYAAVCVMLLASLTIWDLRLDPTRPMQTVIRGSETSVRWQTMTSSWRTLMEHPLLGSGPATHPGWAKNMPFDAHLTPLNIAATLGLPALFALGAALTLIWRNRSRPTNLALWGGLAGMAIDALASDIEDFRHVWVLIGMADADSIETSTDNQASG